MKFKRRTNLVLRDNQNVVVPRGGSWRHSILSDDRDDDFGVLANSNASGKGIYTQVCPAVGAKLKSAASIYITGAAFTTN